MNPNDTGRWTARRGTDEVRNLEVGMDFRRPEYRREVFLRFYGFHLRYKTHPGCVYFLIPWLRDKLAWDLEETLWFCFLNGNTQNPVTSLTIWRRFPLELALRRTNDLYDWWLENSPRLRFDTDRRYFRTKFLAAADAYLENVRKYGSQELYMAEETRGWGWAGAWAWASRLPFFGRLSAFSYLEYLRIAGMPVTCEDLMLEDLKGSQSHRNGLAKVLGRDDLDWHASNPGFDGSYDPKVMDWLKHEAVELLEEAKDRYPFNKDVGNFTLESTLCTYKSWHRPNRRYPNVYADMLLGRIQDMQKLWPDESYKLFRQARADCLPAHLRLEENPNDPGCVPEKQNHYRNTGEVIMMDEYDPVFRNSFNDRIRGGLFG